MRRSDLGARLHNHSRTYPYSYQRCPGLGAPPEHLAYDAGRMVANFGSEGRPGAVGRDVSARAFSSGVARTPRVLPIFLLSTMKGSANWYYIYGSSHRVRLVRAATRISSGLTWRRRGIGLACLLKDKINQLASGVGARFVRKSHTGPRRTAPR
jgi:hypothetical protein